MSERIEVPQATLQRIRAVLDAVAEGATTNDEVSERTSSAGRHAAYGVVAARVLGMLTGPRRGPLELTDSGRGLAETRPGSPEEQALLRTAVTESDVIAQLAPGLLTEQPPSREQITETIQAVASLSASTASHRAAMLLRWRRELGGAGIRGGDLRRAPRGVWRRLELAGFRSYERAAVEVAPFTVLLGANGSGKSNLLDALLLFGDVAADAAEAVSTRGGIGSLRWWQARRSEDLSLELRAASTQRGLEVDFVRHQLTLQSGPAERWCFTDEQIERISRGQVKAAAIRKDNAVTLGKNAKPAVIDATESAMSGVRKKRPFRQASALTGARRLRLDVDAMRRPSAADAPAHLADDGSNLAAAVASLRDDETFTELTEFMTRIVVGLQEMQIREVGEELELWFQQALGADHVAEFAAHCMSEGALRALGIAVAALQLRRDELLILEEPQLSLDLGTGWLLIELLREASRRGAVLVTTHSADLLEVVHEDEVLICQMLDGVSRVGPLPDSQQEAIREGLSSVAGLMRSGALRARV